jgi:hypothetical protein
VWTNPSKTLDYVDTVDGRFSCHLLGKDLINRKNFETACGMTRAALRALSLITGNVVHSCFQWRIVTATCSLLGSTPLEGTRHGRVIKNELKTATDLFKFINRDFDH